MNEPQIINQALENLEDNQRNRLQMFIGKFTDEMQQHLLHRKPKPGAKDQLNNYSLFSMQNLNPIFTAQ